MTTFKQQVEQARGMLAQFSTNRPVKATFTGWVGTAPNFTGITLSGLPNSQPVVNALVELGHELVHVSSHDPAMGTTVCPPWFRQQQGTPKNDSYPVNSVATINPQFPFWHVASTMVAGVANLYPSLFVPKVTTITTSLLTEKYELPADVDEIVSVKFEDRGPVKSQRRIHRWSVDTSAADGKRYLHMGLVWEAGRSVYVTYRAKPTLPSPTGDADWSATGLPASAEDLPVLWTVCQLLPSADAAKVQTMSVEQSERNRFVPPGAANATSRRFQELYLSRLNEEKRRLHDRFPPLVHKVIN